MTKRIRLFSHNGDELVAEWEVGVLDATAQAEFEKLMRDANLQVMDENTELPAKTFDPTHNYVAFRKMAGG